jgi:prepilin-type N-terminal cleavage/methylation domain-containing protein
MRERARAARRSEAGMTLLELMIVIVILGIASDAMFSLLLASYKTYWKGDVATQVQQGGRVALTRMIRDVRAARHLITGVSRTVGSTTVAFTTNSNTSCTLNVPPQLSMVQPHLGTVTLADSSTIYAPDPQSGTGTLPYDGYDVTYYLAASPNSTTPNTAGPYLVRAAYDIVAGTLSVTNIATNVTSLNFTSSGACIGTSTREFTMTITASATTKQTGAPSSQITIVDDVTLRNQ